ncbi:DNA-binding CsgD family transcriptional regulator [Streptomyces sp. V4I2]|nr:DNA-binding CsgD family transcriptional regulator [Streptomyces sp. V4I2]
MRGCHRPRSARGAAGERDRLLPDRDGRPVPPDTAAARIARHVAEGATNREVAQRLAVSTRTVDYHLRNVFAVLGLRSRVELARMVEQTEPTGARP